MERGRELYERYVQSAGIYGLRHSKTKKARKDYIVYSEGYNDALDNVIHRLDVILDKTRLRKDMKDVFLAELRRDVLERKVKS
jgi:hypothetical protein